MTLKELLFNIDTNSAIETIKHQRILNHKQFKLNCKKVRELIDQGKFNQASNLSNKDLLGYFHIYQMAKNIEEEGNLERAANLYWENIYKNGTDAPANFNRLLIVLNKLKLYEEELKIANIFLAFINEGQIEKLNRRIEKLRKRIRD